MKTARFSSMLKIMSVTSLGLMAVTAQADIIPFQSNGRTAAVRYDDLDLGDKAGQRELNARVRRAAVKVCPARTVQESRSCQLVALDQVRAPVAAAIAQARSGDRYAAAGVQALPQTGE